MVEHVFNVGHNDCLGIWHAKTEETVVNSVVSKIPAEAFLVVCHIPSMLGRCLSCIKNSN